MGVGGQLHAPAALPPEKIPWTHCIGGWVGPRAGLDGCEKSRPHRDFFFCLSGVFSLWSIFVLFKSFRPSCHFTFHSTVLTTSTTQTSMPPVGFETTILVSEQPKTHAIDRTATGIGGIRSPDRPARSESLYRLRYPGLHNMCVIWLLAYAAFLI
jgi:hypothetical protein